MASNYPGSLDSFDTIASDKKTSDSVGGRTHRQMHNDLGDAIEAVQGELGVNPSGTYDTVSDRIAAVEDGFPTIAIGTITTGAADVNISGNVEDGYELDFVLPSAENYEIQAAGGSRASGTSHIIGDVNAIASDVGTATILGGGSANRENVIGAATTANVNTATSNLPTATGTEADWSIIVGGYDNVCNGWATAITGFHNAADAGVNHGTIGGGSIHKLTGSASYATISGGTGSTVSGDYGTVSGGSLHTITADGDQGTIGGGSGHTVSAANATISGGSVNTASGTGGTVGGGLTNTASGANAAVGGGSTNTASGNNSTIGGGTNGLASGSSSVVAGGNANQATKSGATVGGGSTNTITSNADYGTIPGGYTNSVTAAYAQASGRESVSSRYGGQVHAAGKITTVGDAQTGVLVARRQTTDATPAVLGLDGTVNTPIIIATNSTCAFRILVVGRRTNAGGEASAAYEIVGAIKNDGGTVALSGTPTTTVLVEDDAAWDCAVTAETTTSKSLTITVTGAAGVTISWVARIEFVEAAG